jgi:hypothetical protein
MHGSIILPYKILEFSLYPDTPMTMVAGSVPSLMTHQLSGVQRRSCSSRCSCCRIGMLLMVTSLMRGRAAPLTPANPAETILESWPGADPD